jgi:hypothetical protein
LIEEKWLFARTRKVEGAFLPSNNRVITAAEAQKVTTSKKI